MLNSFHFYSFRKTRTPILVNSSVQLFQKFSEIFRSFPLLLSTLFFIPGCIRYRGHVPPYYALFFPVWYFKFSYAYLTLPYFDSWFVLQLRYWLWTYFWVNAASLFSGNLQGREKRGRLPLIPEYIVSLPASFSRFITLVSWCWNIFVCVILLLTSINFFHPFIFEMKLCLKITSFSLVAYRLFWLI